MASVHLWVRGGRAARRAHCCAGALPLKSQAPPPPSNRALRRCFAFLPILHFLIAKLPARAPKGAKSAFRTLSWLTIVLWSAYPVVWGIGEGGNLVSPDVETVLYAILDVMCVVCAGSVRARRSRQQRRIGRMSSLVPALASMLAPPPPPTAPVSSAKCGFGFILLFSHAALEAAPGVVPASHEDEALLQTGE